MCYNNQWGGVCSPSGATWRQEEATVVCRQLGYPYGAVTNSSSYRNGDATPIAFLNVDRCDNRGDQLLGCYSYGYALATLGYYNCTGYSDFEVVCTGRANM